MSQNSTNGAKPLRESLVRGLVQQNLAQLGRLGPGNGSEETPSPKMVTRNPRRMADPEITPSTPPRSRTWIRLRGLVLLVCLGYISVFGTSALRQEPSATPVDPKSAPPVWDQELLHDLDVAASAPNGLPMSLAQMFQLRVRRIVIDPGHGGKDPGAKAPSGLEEKAVTLRIAKALGKLLEKRLGSEVILTRQDDTFVALHDRANLANGLEADLFVSIHLNWFPNAKIQRVETYFVGLSNDKESLEIASRENAGGEVPIGEFELVLRRMAQTLKVQESRRFAELVQASLFEGQHKKNKKLKDHGVGRAPFVVLMGTKMPSILAEVSYLSEPEEAKRLESQEYVEGIAQSLADGIARYLSTEAEKTREVRP